MSLKFQDILSQDDKKEYFKDALENGHLSHAYILCGPEGSGKMMLAETITAAIQCEEGGSEACGECRTCHQVQHRNHPDVIYITHEKPMTISVEDIRQQLVDTVSIRPYSAKMKIYIVDEAEKMNQAAQNALLKTIEEPPDFAVIFLLTTNVNAFLPTILSRCIKLYMKPVRQEVLEDYLEKKLKITNDKAIEAAAFSQGYVGEAEKLAVSEEFQEKRKELISIVTGIKDATIVEISSKSKEISKVKEEIPELLNLFTVWFRDVLLYKATESEKELIFTSETKAISEMSDISYKGLDDILRKISDSEKMLKQNVNPELITELLLIKMKEIING